jgi:hypothetical protein
MCQNAPLNRFWMLRPAQLSRQNRNISYFLAGSCPPYKTQYFVTGLRESLQGFQNNGGQSVFVMDRKKKLRPEPNGKSGLAKIGGDTMNRLRMMLVGAALITGGSALASAQMVPQNVAFRDHDRDRDRDGDRDRDRNRGYNNNYRVYRDRDGDRDDRRVYRDRDDRGYYGRYDNDRRYDGYNRRWDGHRWQYWNGYEWVY